jgi:hypothetical protein
LFEIAVRSRWSRAAELLLTLCKVCWCVGGGGGVVVCTHGSVCVFVGPCLCVPVCLSHTVWVCGCVGVWVWGGSV